MPYEGPLDLWPLRESLDSRALLSLQHLSCSPNAANGVADFVADDGASGLVACFATCTEIISVLRLGTRETEIRLFCRTNPRHTGRPNEFVTQFSLGCDLWAPKPEAVGNSGLADLF